MRLPGCLVFQVEEFSQAQEGAIGSKYYTMRCNDVDWSKNKIVLIFLLVSSGSFPSSLPPLFFPPFFLFPPSVYFEKYSLVLLQPTPV